MFEIFQYDFMVRAFIAGIITAVIAPTIGIFLVTRRYSFMADTLAHVSLAGVAIGALTGLQPIATAMAASTIAALSVEQLRSRGNVLGESALSLFLSGGLALSAVLLSSVKSVNINLSSILFGSIATVSKTDIWFIVILGLIVLLTVTVLYRQLLSISIDEELAQSSGLSTALINRIIVVLAAITVSLAMRIVGVLLVGALMVIPVMTAMQLRQSFFRTLIFGICFSLFSVITGLFLSYYIGFASGGTIVLIAILLFFLGTLWRLRPKRPTKSSGIKP